jgi:RNA-directed DNA polymerase
MRVYTNLFEKIISLSNIFVSWEEFKSDKRKKADVQEFEFKLESNLFSLYRDLKGKRYVHYPYSGFYIYDPKVRHVHKASVRDRILHHAVFRILNPLYDKTFIANSFSCRIGKGTHKGVLAVERMIRRESRNFTRPCFALKCDVRKFFDSINHRTLLNILSRKITDQDTMRLLDEVVESYTASQADLFDRQGLPIGNLTSQLFANVYMNEFDQFVKHKLKIINYARYTDDFVIVSSDRVYLENILELIKDFLDKKLQLSLHPNKISIRACHQGVDFLGYVALPCHRRVRTRTKRRIFRKLKERVTMFRRGLISDNTLSQSLQSYLGVFSHANAYQLSEELKNQYWFWLHD